MFFLILDIPLTSIDWTIRFIIMVYVRQCVLFAAVFVIILNFVPGESSPINSSRESAARINDIVDLDPKHARRAMNDVKTTISEVQKILESDPNLPRLTRGEIEELFESVTRDEYEKSMRRGDHNRAKHMRALMVVLPYNTNDMSENQLQVKP